MKIILKENIAKKSKELAEAAPQISKQLPLTMFRILSLLEADIKENIRNRSGLHVRSGSLLNSIQKHVEVRGDTVIGTVGPEGDVPYAGVHEFGHTFPARFVAPRHKKALRWESGGKFFFSKGHVIPSFTVPARPYLQPSMEKLSPMIEEEFGVALELIFKEG